MPSSSCSRPISPIPKGGKDPLAKFDDALAGSSTTDRAKFYHDNMHELLHGASA